MKLELSESCFRESGSATPLGVWSRPSRKLGVLTPVSGSSTPSMEGSDLPVPNEGSTFVHAKEFFTADQKCRIQGCGATVQSRTGNRTKHLKTIHKLVQVLPKGTILPVLFLIRQNLIELYKRHHISRSCKSTDHGGLLNQGCLQRRVCRLTPSNKC